MNVFHFSGMMSSLAKVNKSLGAHFLDAFLVILRFLDVLDIQICLNILQKDDQLFTLKTKKSLHIIFKTKTRLLTMKILSQDDSRQKLPLFRDSHHCDQLGL